MRLIKFFYVAGALARAEVRGKTCQCPGILLEEDSELPAVGSPPSYLDPSVRLFLDQVNRGGLLRPSQLALSICLKGWQVFHQIDRSPPLRQQFLKCALPKRCFSRIVSLSLLQDDELGQEIFSPENQCSSGHQTMENIVTRFFNCLAKNLVSSLSNDKTTASHSRKRKIRKVTSKT